MSKSKLSRRTLVTSAAALPALAMPAAAENADPIFTALKCHQDAEAAATTAFHAIELEETLTEEIYAREEAANELQRESYNQYAALLSVTPTTVVGCAALLRYIDSFETKYEGEDWLFENCRDDVRAVGTGLLSRLAAALEEA